MEENGQFIYDGAIKMPPRMNAAWIAIQRVADLLLQFRDGIGGSDWSICVDAHEIPWDESEKYGVRPFIPLLWNVVTTAKKVEPLSPDD